MTVKVTWLGHAFVKLEYNGKVILIDPWLDNPKFPGKQHIGDNVDLILITHGHLDHGVRNAVELAKEFKPKIPVIHEMAVFLETKEVENVVGMNFGGIYDFEGIKITLVPSSHSGGFQDEEGMHYLGAAGGYVISFPDSNIFYHCGDTGVTAEMNVIADMYCPNIGLLAIGGHYTMGPKGAAYVAKMMNLRKIIPIHWGTFVPPLNGTPEKLRKALHEVAGATAEVNELKPGESITFESAEDIEERSKSFYS